MARAWGGAHGCRRRAVGLAGGSPWRRAAGPLQPVPHRCGGPQLRDDRPRARGAGWRRRRDRAAHRIALAAGGLNARFASGDTVCGPARRQITCEIRAKANGAGAARTQVARLSVRAMR